MPNDSEKKPELIALALRFARKKRLWHNHLERERRHAEALLRDYADRTEVSASEREEQQCVLRDAQEKLDELESSTAESPPVLFDIEARPWSCNDEVLSDHAARILHSARLLARLEQSDARRLAEELLDAHTMMSELERLADRDRQLETITTNFDPYWLAEDEPGTQLVRYERFLTDGDCDALLGARAHLSEQVIPQLAQEYGRFRKIVDWWVHYDLRVERASLYRDTANLTRANVEQNLPYPFGGGKNSKHANPKRRMIAKLNASSLEYEITAVTQGNEANKARKIECLKRRLRAQRLEGDFSGEHHSQRSKRSPR